MTPTLKPRFIKTLRERASPDGATDRYWVVIDKALNDFQVLKVNTTYPGAESLVQVYAAELNRLNVAAKSLAKTHAAELNRLGKKEANDDAP
jgi:hypothetical protein